MKAASLPGAPQAAERLSSSSAWGGGGAPLRGSDHTSNQAESLSRSTAGFYMPVTISPRQGCRRWSSPWPARWGGSCHSFFSAMHQHLSFLTWVSLGSSCLDWLVDEISRATNTQTTDFLVGQHLHSAVGRSNALWLPPGPLHFSFLANSPTDW